MTIRRTMFEESSANSDWRFAYRLIVPNMVGWDFERDEIVLGMSPDWLAWDDYGWHSRAFPPGTADASSAPWYTASSRDGSGVVSLYDPDQIDIVVPSGVIRGFGTGMVNVGLSLRDVITQARTAILTGRLPLINTVV
jgi:hypothetical protein